MRILLAVLLVPVLSLAQSAGTAGKYATLQISGAGTFGSTVTATGFTSSNTTTTTLTTATTATAGTDIGLKLRNSATLTGNSAHADQLLQMFNGSAATTATYAFSVGGRFHIVAAADNAAPGFRFQTPSSNSDLILRTTGGSGEIMDWFSNSTTITRWKIGNCPATNCSMGIGPSAGDAGTGELELYKGTSGPAAQFNVGIRPARIALPTCAAGNEGMLVNDVAAGLSTGNATRVCMCQSDGAGTPAWAWKNIITGNAGNTTTCAN